MKRGFLKRLAAFSLAVFVASPLSAFAASFTDVNANDWFFDSVEQLVRRGIAKGYEDNSFRPQKTVTRAEFLKMTMAGLEYKEQSLYGEHWAKAWLDKAYEKGLLDDYDKKAFNISSIDQPITRAQMAKLAVRSTRVIPSSKDINSYITDFSSIEAEYKDYVRDAVFEGIITGYPDNTFMPYNTLTRAEASVVIDRILDRDDRKPPTMTIYTKRMNDAKNFFQPYSKNVVFNETTGNSFIYNSIMSESPSQDVLSSNGSFNYDFMVEVMTEPMKTEKGYDYIISYRPDIDTQAKNALETYLKTLMPYNYTGIVNAGIENLNSGAGNTRSMSIDGWKLLLSSTNGTKQRVVIQISR